MNHSAIPPDLIAAYRATRYWVEAAPDRFCLRIDEHSPELAALLRSASTRCAAYLTACNPFSVVATHTENERANRALREAVQQYGVTVIAGTGRDARSTWEEPSFLALGLGIEDARRLGVRFRQNAMVWSDGDAIPRLILLR